MLGMSSNSVMTLDLQENCRTTSRDSLQGCSTGLGEGRGLAGQLVLFAQQTSVARQA